MSIKLILVRHGRTKAYEKGIIQGQTHAKLSKTGRDQAARVAYRLKDEPINIAYTSDLKRAKDTAKEIMKYHKDVKLYTSKSLRELSKGYFDGKTKELAKKELDESEDLLYEHVWPDADNYEGESLILVQKRTVEFYENLLKKHSEKNVLIVSHGHPIRTLLLHLRCVPLNDFYFELEEELKFVNTSVTRINIDDSGTHEEELMNCYEHLDDII